MNRSIDIYFTFHEDSFHCSVPAWGLEESRRNLLAFYADEMKLISIGDRIEDMQARNPTAWQAIAKRVKVEPIYNPRNLVPASLYSVICFFVRSFIFTRYPLLVALLMHRWLRIHLHLELPDYDEVSYEARAKLEYNLLKSDNPRFVSLHVNGQLISQVDPDLDRAVRKFTRQERIVAFLMGMSGIIGLILGALLPLILTVLVYDARPVQLPSWLAWVLLMIIMVASMIYGARLGTVAGLMVLSKFFPPIFFRAHLARADKALLKWKIVRRFLNEQSS